MGLEKKTPIWTAEDTNATYDYRISGGANTNDVVLYLDIVGSVGYDGTVSFYWVGLNEDPSIAKVLDFADLTNKVSLTPGVTSTKFQITGTGWEYFRLVITGRATGTTTAWITEHRVN